MAKKTTEEISVRKCRYNGRSIRCEWEQGSDAYAVTFHDNPLPSFLKALKALSEHVCSLCDLPSKDADKIEPTGITISPMGEENAQALIVAKKKIRKGKRVFNISTPLLAMYPAEDVEKKGSDAMDPEEAKAIEKFATEVRKYIRNGPDDRAQGKLALEEEKPDPKDKKGGNTEEFPTMSEPGADEGKK